MRRGGAEHLRHVFEVRHRPSPARREAAKDKHVTLRPLAKPMDAH